MLKALVCTLYLCLDYRLEQMAAVASRLSSQQHTSVAGSADKQQPSGPRGARTACNQCAARKRRCDGDGTNACSLCARAKRDCTYHKVLLLEHFTDVM
jgi:Fungal Zn(2)-Cys(6) binuclear cluster domain